MDEIQAKMKRWVKAIVAMEIRDMIDELEVLLDFQIAEKTDKSLFKLLLHLSHAAHVCDRSESKLGLDMCKLANFLCSNISSISDHGRFFSSVFHITKCLLEMKLYEEAMEIFDFLMPGKRQKDESRYYKEMYSKASVQWKVTVCNVLLRNLDPNGNNEVEILTKSVKYEWDTLRLGSHDYSNVILERMIFYVKHVRSIAKRSEASRLDTDFTTFILDYVRSNDISSSNENANEIFKLICQLITAILAGPVNERNIREIGRKSDLCFNVFRSTVKSHQRCLNVFDLYASTCNALLKPVEDLTLDTVRDIDAWNSELKSTIDCNVDDEFVKSFLNSAYFLFCPLLVYWEEVATIKFKYLTDNNFIVSVLKFFSTLSGAFSFYEPSNCRCGPETCRAKYDLYSAIVLQMKSVSAASRVISHEVTNGLDDVAQKLAKSSLKGISKLKDMGCKRWMELWASCGAYIYNMALSCEASRYELSRKLHSLLFHYVVRLEDLNSAKPIVNLKDPLSDVLHRLTSVHFNHGKYDDASIACSLNGLLTYEKSESKAFRYWANIKRKDPRSHGITMLQCLRSNKETYVRNIKIDLKNYDQVALCLREIKGLQDGRTNFSSSIIAILDEMERLNASPHCYAQGVQFLGYHSLNFQHETYIEEFVKKATLKYEHSRCPSASFRWCYGHLLLYRFIARIAEISMKTRREIELTESTTAPVTGLFSADGNSESTYIVPTYSTTSLTRSIELEGLLKIALQRLEEAHDYGFKGILKDWEMEQAVRVVIIAGEYARLYNFEQLEIRAWNLAYKLADELKDDATIIYVTTRSLTGLQIDRRWIDRANECAERLASNEDREINERIARYKLCLANFYFASNQCVEAKRCFHQADAHIGENFLADLTNYLLRHDIVLNYLLDDDESTDLQMEYHRIIVEILYGLMTLHSKVEAVTAGNKEQLLYDYEVILKYTNIFSTRINSLLSFQEISAHLNLRLTTAQKLGAALRVAECLKSLCYIDLSRAQLDDCEVKLQGLEQILDITGLDLFSRERPFPSPRKKTTLAISPTRLPGPSESSVGQNDGSPVLRKKRFDLPDFVLHDDCKCFKCTNVGYMYLVFACMHIRAQLYTLQRNSVEAMQHFTGAIEFRERMLMKNSSNMGGGAAKKMEIVQLESQQTMLEYVMFHLDYCRFLKFYMPTHEKEVTAFSQQALKLCEAYHLTNHPIYTAVNEFILECRFEKVFTKEMYAKFTVPAIADIDVSAYLDEPIKRPIACSTPARDMAAKEVKSVRRKKTPPFLKLNKVPIDLAEEDEDEEKPISEMTPLAAKRTRRKISEQDYSDAEVANSERKSVVPKIKVIMPKEEAFARTPKLKVESSDDRGNLAVGLPSIVSVSLNSVGEDELYERSQSEGQLDKLVDTIKELKIHPQTQSSTRTRIRQKSQQESGSSSRSSSAEASGKLPEEIGKIKESFDRMTVSKSQTSALDPPSRSSRTRKPATNDNCGESKKSSLVSRDESKRTLLSDCDSDTGDDGRRSSARLRKKRVPSNTEDEVVVVSTGTRKRPAASSTEPTAMPKEVSKSTRTRVTKKST